MQIKILDGIECQVLKKDGVQLVPCLSFEAMYWKQGPHKKTKHTYQKHVFSFKGKTHWCFYTGLLPRVTKWCEDQGIPVEIVGEEIKIPVQAEPFLKGPGFKEFREDQLKLIDVACKKQRGIIVAPTGVGKTLIFLGIISCYPKLKILILSHTTTITRQTVDELQKFGFKDVELFGGGEKIKKPSKRIVVSTIQSFSKLPKEDYIDYFDCAIVDEMHRVSKQDSMYSKVLGNMLAPIRLGFSATPLKRKEAQLVYEGLIGPIIGRLTMQEATDLKILAEPRLRLIKAEYPQELTTIWNYQDKYEKIRVEGKLVNGERLERGAYTVGITENTARHRQIANLTKEFTDKNQTVLIFVTHIEHGLFLQQEIEKQLGYQIPFIQGSMPQDDREEIKKKLIKKEIKAGISTISWSEGLNIKTLNCLILAGGGRSETQLLQKIGRVLRRTKDKDQAIIISFLDLGNRHLILHTGDQLSLFSDMGWI